MAEIIPIIQEPRKFFIAYKQDSADDLAERLHKALHERGADAFLDVTDIEKGLTEEKWREQRDRALLDCEEFILIVTNGTCFSEEVKNEIKLALSTKGKIRIRVFIDKEIWTVDEEVTINLDGTIHNLKDWQVDSFTTPASLVRIVTSSSLLVRKIEKEILLSIFDNLEQEFTSTTGEIQVQVKCNKGHVFNNWIIYGGVVSSEVREMGNELMHVWNNSFNCPVCDEELDIELTLWEYPFGTRNYADFDNNNCEVINKKEIGLIIGIVPE